jgi:hypothetical protein
VIERLDNPVRTVTSEFPEFDGTKPAPPIRRSAHDGDRTFDEDAVVEAVIAKLKDRAPALLKVLVTKPEMQVVVERQVLEVDGKTLRGRLARLIADGWFNEIKAGNAAYQELQRLGFSTAKPNVYRELDGITGLGFLTKEDGGFLAVKTAKVDIIRR